MSDQVAEVGGGVCTLCVCIQQVQCFIVTGETFHVLGEEGQSRGHGGLIIVTEDEEKGVWVLSLNLRDDSV